MNFNLDDPVDENKERDDDGADLVKARPGVCGERRKEKRNTGNPTTIIQGWGGSSH